LHKAIMGTCLSFHLAGGVTGMEHFMRQSARPSSAVDAACGAELSGELISRLAEGTRR